MSEEQENTVFEGTEEERREEIATAFLNMGRTCDCCRRYSKDEIREAIDVGISAQEAIVDYISDKAKVSRNPTLAMFFALKELEAHMPTTVAVTGAAAFSKGLVN